MGDIEKLVEIMTDRAMTGEGRASVLAYARGRLDAQREFNRQTLEIFSAEAEKSSGDIGAYLKQTAE